MPDFLRARFWGILGILPLIITRWTQFWGKIHFSGAVAQSVERSVRNAEVRGSIPLGSNFVVIIG